MSFAALQQALFTEGKKQVAVVRSKYQKQIAQEEERISRQARELEEAIIERANETGKLKARRIHQVAQLKAKADILTTKQDVLLKARDRVTQSVLAWDEAKARRLIETLLGLVSEESGTIAAGQVHENLVRQLAEKRGLQVAQETLEGEGGFIFRSKRSELKVTVSHLVELLFKQTRAEMAQILFD